MTNNMRREYPYQEQLFCDNLETITRYRTRCVFICSGGRKTERSTLVDRLVKVATSQSRKATRLIRIDLSLLDDKEDILGLIAASVHDKYHIDLPLYDLSTYVCNNRTAQRVNRKALADIAANNKCLGFLDGQMDHITATKTMQSIVRLIWESNQASLKELLANDRIDKKLTRFDRLSFETMGNARAEMLAYDLSNWPGTNGAPMVLCLENYDSISQDQVTNGELTELLTGVLSNIIVVITCNSEEAINIKKLKDRSQYVVCSLGENDNNDKGEEDSENSKEIADSRHVELAGSQSVDNPVNKRRALVKDIRTCYTRINDKEKYQEMVDVVASQPKDLYYYKLLMNGPNDDGDAKRMDEFFSKMLDYTGTKGSLYIETLLSALVSTRGTKNVKQYSRQLAETASIAIEYLTANPEYLTSSVLVPLSMICPTTIGEDVYEKVFDYMCSVCKIMVESGDKALIESYYNYFRANANVILGINSYAETKRSMTRVDRMMGVIDSVAEALWKLDKDNTKLLREVTSYVDRCKVYRDQSQLYSLLKEIAEADCDLNEKAIWLNNAIRGYNAFSNDYHMAIERQKAVQAMSGYIDDTILKNLTKAEYESKNGDCYEALLERMLSIFKVNNNWYRRFGVANEPTKANQLIELNMQQQLSFARKVVKKLYSHNDITATPRRKIIMAYRALIKV